MRFATIVLLAGGLSGAVAAPPKLPDFAYTVSVRGRNSYSAVCVARNGDAGHARRLAGLGEVDGASWSPNGRRIAISLQRRTFSPIRVTRADASAGHPLSRPRLRTELDSVPDWSGDGAKVAFGRYVFYGPGHDYRRFGLWVVDAASRVEHHFSRRFPTSTAWSPSGDRVAARFGGDLSVFSASGRLLWTARSSETGPVAWSPAGDLIAASFGREVRLLAPDGTSVRAFLRPASSFPDLETGLSWSPDGSRLALGGGAVVDRVGLVVARYAAPSTRQAVAFEPRWSPDGTAIVYQRARVVLVGSRYSSHLTTGPADLFAFAPATGATTRLTSTPAADERDVLFRPGAGHADAGRPMPCLLEGTPRRDVIRGTGGQDLEDGRGGADLILGGGGDDVLFARDGARDVVRGGPGFDRAWVDRGDLVTGVERVYRR